MSLKSVEAIGWYHGPTYTQKSIFSSLSRRILLADLSFPNMILVLLEGCNIVCVCARARVRVRVCVCMEYLA